MHYMPDLKEKNKGRQRLRWIDSLNENNRINWTDIKGSNGLENRLRTMEVINSYPSLQNGMLLDMMMMMMMMMMTTTMMMMSN